MMLQLFATLPREALAELLNSTSTSSSQHYYTTRYCNPLALINTSSHFQSMLQEIREEADKLLTVSIPELTDELFALFEQNGNRLHYESAYFERRRRLTAFSLLVLLESDSTPYYNALLEVIEAILHEKTWCLPAHMKGEDFQSNIDLFSAETGFALAEIMTLLHDMLPEELKASILERIEARIFTPYLMLRSFSWETATHNWASVCAGSIGATALLLLKDTEKQAAAISKALRTMDYYLSGFGSDGACLEGLGYWNYGFGYFVYFADLLHTATEGRMNLFLNAKVKAIAQFQQHCYLSGNRPANFSDAAPHANLHFGLCDYLASQYWEVMYPPVQFRASFIEDHCSRFAPALRNFLWFRSDIARSDAWEQGSWYFPDAAWLISRHVSSSGNFGFAAKGGCNQEPHNHIDVGHFILIAGNDPAFAADLGSGEYTAAYFGSERYSYSCTSSSGHSLPIIAGMSQQAEKSSSATILKASIGSQADILSIDLTACYPIDFLRSYTRTFIWNKGELPSLYLEDVIECSHQDGIIEEIFITKCPVKFVADGELQLRGHQYVVKLCFSINTYHTSIHPCIFNNHEGQEEHYTQIKLTLLRDRTAALNKLGFHFIFEEIQKGEATYAE